MSEAFSCDFCVRDYECDMQGIVNNAVYQNYLEHTRHDYLRSRGLDFAALTKAGVHMVVLRAELDYLRPLVSGDRFRVTLRAERISQLKVVFFQEIVRGEEELVLRAVVTAGVIAGPGRPELPQPLADLLASLPKGSRRRPARTSG